jgi:hypothetical protein
MKKVELYSYLILVGYIIVAILLSGLWAQSKGLSPQVGAKIAAEYTTLPFFAWIVLTVYYLVRWSARKTHSKVGLNKKNS